MIHKSIGLGIVVMCLYVIYAFEQSAGSGAFRILHWPAMVLTGVGPLGLILLSSDEHRLKSAWAMLFRSAGKLRTRWEREGDSLREISHAYYTKGPASLDSFDTKALSPYLQRTLSRLAIQMPVSDAREILERERERVEGQVQQGQSAFQLGVRLAPSLGMLGTILGMVHLLSNLKDPGEIGSNMSLALLTTFYGLFFSLLVWTPLEQKAQSYLDAEMRGFDQALTWLDLLERRKPAQYIVEGMSAPSINKERIAA